MSKKLDLFFKSNVLVINPDLAKMIGLNEAIVLNQIYYWISVNKKQNRNFHDGKYWCYNSIREWQEENFPFWSYNISFTKEKQGISKFRLHFKIARNDFKQKGIDVLCYLSMSQNI